MNNLSLKLAKIKKRFLEMYLDANAGHVGSSLSCAEILTWAKFCYLKPQGDHLILSKGHAAACLYSVLIESGDLTELEGKSFYKNGTLLAAHPPGKKLPGIPFGTGSLGHGLSLAVGLAKAAKLQKSNRRICCVTSDGELNEGSIWEAALYGAHEKFTNILWLIDRNFLQGFGRTSEVLEIEPLAEKISAFGWQVTVCDGHSFLALDEAYEKLSANTEKPKAIICNTIKGRLMPSLQDTVDCHYLPMTRSQFDTIIKSVDRELELGLAR